jgi:hypothetical protein
MRTITWLVRFAKQAIRETADIQVIDAGIVFRRADGSEIIRLEQAFPNGFELRRFTVSAFRFAGKLRNNKSDPDSSPISRFTQVASKDHRAVGDGRYQHIEEFLVQSSSFQ